MLFIRQHSWTTGDVNHECVQARMKRWEKVEKGGEKSTDIREGIRIVAGTPMLLKRAIVIK